MIFKQMYSGGGEFVLNITSSVANPNIPALASAAGWNGSGFLKVNITAAFVNRIALLNSWSFPSGIEIEISSGTLVGGNRDESSTGFTTQIPVSVRNLGTIAGIGGRGGVGATTFVTYNSVTVDASGGEGGLGRGFALGTSTTPNGPFAGSSGGYAEYSGPVFGGDTRPWAQGGSGGAGGDWGQAGTPGSYGSVGGSYNSSGTSVLPTNGATPGNSVIGNSFITWLATGTRLGPISA